MNHDKNNSALREQAIRTIECLYPADSPSISVRLTGQELLRRAQLERMEWRYEPTGVLLRYAELCSDEQDRQQRQAERNAENGI